MLRASPDRQTSVADRDVGGGDRAGLQPCSGAAAGSGRRAARTGPGWTSSRACARRRRADAGARAGRRRVVARRDGSGAARPLPDTRQGAPRPPRRGVSGSGRAVSALVHEQRRPGRRCCLDDLHAADQSSLSLLHFVARQLRPMRVLLLPATRDVERGWTPATSDLLSRVAARGRRCRWRGSIGPPPLASSSSASAPRADVEARVLESPARQPALPREMVRLWNEQGRSDRRGGVPTGCVDVIRQRLDRVAPETRELLQWPPSPGTSSIHGVRAAAGATRRGPRPVSARRAAPASGARGPRRFGHALFREVLYHDLPEGESARAGTPRRDALERLAAGQAARDRAPCAGGPPEMLGRAVQHTIRRARARQELLALRGDGQDAGARAGRDHHGGESARPARSPSCWRSAKRASAAARLPPANKTAGKRRPCARARRCELARASRSPTAACRVRDRRSGAVGMLEESLEALPAGDSALPRAAGPPGGRPATEPEER